MRLLLTALLCASWMMAQDASAPKAQETPAAKAPETPAASTSWISGTVDAGVRWTGDVHGNPALRLALLNQKKGWSPAGRCGSGTLRRVR